MRAAAIVRMLVGSVVALAGAASLASRSLHAVSPCASLAGLALPGGSIAQAEDVSAGALAAPAQLNAALVRSLPAFCRITATLRPSTGSEIKIETWLPASGWNGKFQAVGNGAFSGAINYAALAAAITRGYAASSTDTGHSGGSASFALDHPEQVDDFGWRAVHEMSVAAKRIIAAYYQSPAKYAYWNGCSAGGRQGMKEAQRFPADFDGIIAGAPALDWTSRASQAVRIAQRLETSAAARLLAGDRERLHRAVLEACDAADGVRDGLLENPSTCGFDPVSLQCRTGSGGDSGCLTPEQVETARSMYSPMKNAATGRAITGLERGSELGWTDLGWTGSARATGLDHFRFLVFHDPRWDVSQFRGAADVARAEESDNHTINALDPNLKPFIDRGGKLIQYHGWGDPQISPGNSTQYYSRVLEVLGGKSKVDAAYRLFMVPGMGHCGGGEGPNTFDTLAALEDWVERGRAPDRIIAAHSANGAVDRTRPLCPFPQTAVYTGAGSINDAANFVCRAP